jgi:hypothetical protein
MKNGVVLDKNFLQGANSQRVRELAESHRLIMPGALFYELMTTSSESRRKCFSKLPQTENPVVLVDHMGLLLAYELARHRPAGQPSGHRIHMRFRFNERLLSEDYVLPDEAKQVIYEQTLETEQDIDRLIDLSEQTPSLFQGLLSGTTAQRASALSQAETAISRLDVVQRFYQVLQAPEGAPAYPHLFGRLGKWAHLRWLQVQMLFSLHLYVRHQGRLREELTPKGRIRLEHDVHDAQILAFGILEGALATSEVKLVRWWSLLRPDGEIFSRTN